MNKVLISACLLGERVRYDGNALPVSDGILKKWMRDGRAVQVCPEVIAGMGIPRPPAEISNGDGGAVLDGTAKVLDRTGKDVTDAFLKGALVAMSLCQHNEIRIAVLAEGSPSCGSSMVYDGSFSGLKTAGAGVTTALLRKNGIRVFNQHELPAANLALQKNIR